MIIYVRILSVGDLGLHILLSGSKAPLTVLDELRVINSTFGLVLLDLHGMALLRHSLALQLGPYRFTKPKESCIQCIVSNFVCYSKSLV